jgi:flagellar assembly protein FliH
MISLSSIVKAGSLSMVPGNREQSNNGLASVTEMPGMRISQEENGDRREQIIRQAIQKSKYIDNEAMKRADSLIEGAYKKCQQIMLDAEKKGFADGYSRGMAEGQKAATLKANDGLTEIQDLIKAINNERINAIFREEQDLLTIAFEIAQKIMKKQAELDEDAILGILEEIISENPEELKICLSNYNKSLNVHIDKNIAKRIKAASRNTKVVFVQGEDIILAETQSGTTDLSIKVQLEQLQEALGVEK